MKKTVASTLVVSMCCLQLSGCANMSAQQKGATIGAVAGAVLGAAAGGDRKGVLIGAALGALAGAIIADYQDKQTATRDEAARKYGAAKQDRLIINNSSLTPKAVSPGEKVESAVTYTTLATNQNQQVKLTETRTLINSKERIQLASRDVTRPQGSHVSTLKFTLPKDIAKGNYTLVTTVSDGKSTRTVKNPLRIA